MEAIKIFEAYPDEVLARVEQRDRQRLLSLPPSLDGVIVQLVLEDANLWQVGILEVSFKGGTPELHRRIADCASEWSKHANLTFDFGFESKTGTYRVWTPDDYSHIRVGFQYAGYWSLVGTDSRDPQISRPGDITLNLQGFDLGLPSDWQGTVLHEFGHAIGFLHQHQAPNSNCDFNWPRVYEYLGGHPNYWPKSKVDFNMRQLPSAGLTYGPHDKESIMHYSFPSWMFLRGKESPCCTQQNIRLSQEDQRIAGKAYPFSQEAFEVLRTSRIENLTALIRAAQDDVTAEPLRTHLEYLETNVPPSSFFR